MDGGAWWAAVHGVAKRRTWLSDFTFTFHFHVLEKEMATHSSVLAWRIPGTGEPGGLPSLGSHRVGHDWSDLAAAAATPLWPHLNLISSTIPTLFPKIMWHPAVLRVRTLTYQLTILTESWGQVVGMIWLSTRSKAFSEMIPWTFLGVQWIRIRLAMQGKQVRSLAREDSTCCDATKPVHHDYWACEL